MNNTDIVTILGNISQSLYPVQHLITGFAYVLGLIFFYTAIEKLKKLAEHHGQQGGSHDSVYSPIMYILVGSAFIYLPSALDTLASTAFGTGNVLTYPTLDRSNVYSVVGAFIRTAGIVWFIRGSVLVAHASEPGSEHGLKGLMFIVAGILCMNFDNTVAYLNSSMNYFINLTLSLKASQGF